MNFNHICMSIVILNLFTNYLSASTNELGVTNNNKKIIENDQWKIMYESSLKDTSMVKFLPHEKPEFYEFGTDKSSFFKSCFRSIRQLLKNQWKQYKSQRNYKNPKLIPEMIKIGDQQKFSPPLSIEEGKQIFNYVKDFCTEIVEKYFKLQNEREELFRKCRKLGVSPPKIIKFKRSMLPRDVRCRGENILLQMEEEDQKRIKEIEIEKENFEKIKKGELLPDERKIPIYELLERYSNGKNQLEASQYIENKAFYDNWIKNDSKLTEKLENIKLMNESPFFKDKFGIKYQKDDDDKKDKLDVYKKTDPLNNQEINSFIEGMKLFEKKIDFPKNFQINLIEKGVDSIKKTDSSEKKTESFNKEENNKILNYIIDNKIVSDDDFNILISEKKELGIPTFEFRKKPSNTNLLINGPTNYYTNIKGPISDINYNFNKQHENISYFNKNLNLGPRSEIIKKKIEESNIRDPDKLVPLQEVYVIPDIYKPDYKELKQEQTEENPLGFDRHGLLKVPFKERTKEEYETRLNFGKLNRDDFGKIILDPLPIKNPKNEKVFYINVAGLRKILNNYDLNPSYKNDPEVEKEKYYEKDDYLKDVLKDFLKIIEKKRRKKKVLEHSKKHFKNESMRQRVKSAYKTHMTPKKTLKIVPPQEFAALEDLKDTTALGAIRNNNKNNSFRDSNLDDKENFNKSDSPIYILSQREAEEFSNDSDDQVDRHRVVRFQISEPEKKNKKKYVSPPPNFNEDNEDD